ncbi:MAG: hypothetical protein ACR2NA_00045, partial [Solirubrobacterales bacterium]
GPFQTVCNNWNYGWYQLWNHLSEEDPIGTAQRQFVVSAPPSEEANGSISNYSGIPATGQREPDGFFEPDTIPVGRIAGPPGKAINDDGTANCLVGQTGFTLGAGPARAPGQRLSDPSITDVTIPVNRGTTYAGRARRP